MSNTTLSHARKNLLTGDWVLVSPQRLERPWQGAEASPVADDLPQYDPECYLCPGNARANAHRMPVYRGPYAFDNDFPALSASGLTAAENGHVFVSRPESGRCRVVCYTERHDQRLSTLPAAKLEAAIRVLIDEFVTLDADESVGYVQIFENRGEMMGCSNPHPHAQVWATAGLPDEPAKELVAQAGWVEAHGSPLLVDYLHQERDRQSRIVYDNGAFVSLVPYWAVWPFETILLPDRPIASPDEMDAAEIRAFADCLHRTLGACDKLFDTPAPYSLGLHPRPSDGRAHPEWVFHCHVYPPLLRSAGIRKHLVGFEMLAMPQRDLTPEAAALRLRQCLAE